MPEFYPINTIGQVHEMFGLEPPKHPLVCVVRIYDYLSKVEMPDIQFVPNFYNISLKTGIAGTCDYGRNTYDFGNGTIICSAPGQVLHFNQDAEMPDNKEGWVLIFHSDLIRKSELGKTINNYTFFGYEISEALHISNEEKRILTDTVLKIEKEYEYIIDRHSQELIIANIELILKYCDRFYERQFYTRSNLNKDYISRFERLLKDYYDSDKPIHLGLPTVQYCAAELNLSAKYLSDLLKKETAQSALEHIHKSLLDRGKTELLRSTHTVSEVAYNLGFQHSQHFSTFFKKNVDLTPTEYRVKVKGNNN